jgi:hypothetical protein
MNRTLPGLLLLCMVFTAGAQDAPVQSAYDHERDAPRAAAVQATGSIRIDGVLDEAAWQAARPITSFTQLDPQEGQPASERTEIRVLFDDDALYVGAWLYDREPVTARLGRRDMSMSASDWLTLILDSNHDHRSAFGFELNPAGVRRDQTRAGGQEDDSWDPVWEAAATVSDSGWFAEIRIPFSQLRFTREQVQTWGMQIERQIARNQEFSVWAFTPRDQPGGAPRYGHLSGLANIPTGKRLEVMPYVVSRGEWIDRRGNPFRTSREFEADAGLDLKYRISSNHTLDMTINPDFGQVEVDPAVINLTAFETFFPERRPFFVEGAELFRFAQDGTNSLFYSRRIGKQPSLHPPFAARDVPDATRILGAAKVTGRSAGGWAIGVLDAVTSREIARFVEPTGEYGETVAEPLTNYFAARTRREGRAGQTAVGAFAGAVNRDFDGGDALAQVLRSAAYSGGLDFSHQWDQRTWTLNTFVAGSHVRGDEDVIAATQRLPYHYFQRPDADHLDYDPARTSLTGFAGRVALSKRAGRHWSYSGNVNTITPEYEISDLGFQRRADRIDVQASVNYTQPSPGRLLRRWEVYFNPLVEHNYDWDNISNRIFFGGFAQLLNYWTMNVNFTVAPLKTVDDRLTRGGPAAERPRSASVNVGFSSDPRRPVVASMGTFFETGPGDGSQAQFFTQFTLKPAPHWELRVGPQYVRGISEAQYLQRVPDSTATHTYGARYVFAGLDQRIFAVETRLNYTFTPGLSLQLYAQPFIAAGSFGPPKELAAPGAYEFLVYGRDVGEMADGRVYPTGQTSGGVSFALPQPDFNVRSLRGNAVLRWEWRPGSTMYVAWQQTRNDFRPIGDLELGRDLDALFATSPDNILLVKFSYWMNP